MRPAALLFAALLCAPSAQAASGPAVYVNGVRAEALRDTVLKGVNVRVDAQGNVWIDAPQYAVEVDGRTGAAAAAAPVEAGRYWLVVEDSGSAGHSVQVAVNGALVRTITSGGNIRVLDLAPFLRHGANTVVLQAAAITDPASGTLNVHVGTGATKDGALVVDRTVGSIFRRPDNAGVPDSRTLQLDIP